MISCWEMNSNIWLGHLAGHPWSDSKNHQFVFLECSILSWYRAQWALTPAPHLIAVQNPLEIPRFTPSPFFRNSWEARVLTRYLTQYHGQIQL